eukprot:scaffold48_cov311-Pinguiococcus_pyrenoidosus.AAC.36
MAPPWPGPAAPGSGCTSFPWRPAGSSRARSGAVGSVDGPQPRAGRARGARRAVSDASRGRSAPTPVGRGCCVLGALSALRGVLTLLLARAEVPAPPAPGLSGVRVLARAPTSCHTSSLLLTVGRGALQPVARGVAAELDAFVDANFRIGVVRVWSLKVDPSESSVPRQRYGSDLKRSRQASLSGSIELIRRSGLRFASRGGEGAPRPEAKGVAGFGVVASSCPRLPRSSQ